MSHIRWEDKYSVNVAVIDEQHQKLFEILNTLFDASAAGKTQEVIAAIIKDIGDYAVYHFSTEETLMKSYDFPGLVEHKREHDAFREKVTKFHDALAKKKATLTLEIETFLIDWLDHHVLDLDRKYGPFLNEKGVF